MAAATSFRSGKAGRITIDGTALALSSWSVSENGQDLDTTNFENWTNAYGSTGTTPDGVDQGRSFTTGLIGTETAKFDISGYWDAANPPFEDPPSLYVSDDGGPLLLYINRTDATCYTFPVIRITQSKIDVSPDKIVTFSISGESQGPYTRPAQA